MRVMKKIRKHITLYEKIISNKISSISFDQITLGDSLAKELNLKIGDEIKIAIPKTDKTLLRSTFQDLKL